jgi:hypothetical protein
MSHREGVLDILRTWTLGTCIAAACTSLAQAMCVTPKIGEQHNHPRQASKQTKSATGGAAHTRTPAQARSRTTQHTHNSNTTRSGRSTPRTNHRAARPPTHTRPVARSPQPPQAGRPHRRPASTARDARPMCGPPPCPPTQHARRHPAHQPSAHAAPTNTGAGTPRRPRTARRTTTRSAGVSASHHMPVHAAHVRVLHGTPVRAGAPCTQGRATAWPSPLSATTKATATPRTITHGHARAGAHSGQQLIASRCRRRPDDYEP